MSIVWYIIIILLFLYFSDKLLCCLYCRAKVKRLQIQKNYGPTIINKPLKKGGKWMIKQLLYGWMMYSVSRLGRVPLQKYRLFILRHIYQMKIANNVVIYGNFRLRAPWNISIGQGTVIGDGAQLDGRNGLIIGENVNISSDVYIYTEQHEVNDEYFESGKSGGPVIIENRVWLSSRTTILPKVRIGEGAVLASGAIATKDIEPFSINAGVPAKKIAERNHELKYEFDGSYIPFY